MRKEHEDFYVFQLSSAQPRGLYEKNNFSYASKFLHQTELSAEASIYRHRL